METSTKETSHGNAKNEETGKQLSIFKDDPTQLFQNIQIPDTPFQLVKTPNNETQGQAQWFVTMGRYRLSPEMRTIEEAIENSQDTSWQRIMQVIHIMIQDHQEKSLKKLKQDLDNMETKP